MSSELSRRAFMCRSAQAGIVAAGAGQLAFLNHLSPVSADEAKVPHNLVQLHPDIEPLVRLIEDTPRNRLLETVGDKVRSGVSYQQILAALLLAGVRSIKPRPVGFKFHAVLVVNSAHLASLDAPDRDRWLPLFWALDNFKDAQAQNKTQSGDWKMAPVEESKLPAGHQAKKRFTEAMDNWDVDGADAAIASLSRTAGAAEIFELFWRYGARDFRDIGHKAIYAANAWRTLNTIGWRHAEPVLRSLTFALLEHEGTNPAKRDAEPDLPWRENLSRAGKIRAQWQRGTVSSQAAADLLTALRTATPGEAGDKVVDLLNKNIDPASVWDGLFLTAGELLMRQPGIVGVHCVTSANALYHAFQVSANDETRRMTMLQAAAFLALFRKFMLGRGKLRDDLKLDTLEKAELKTKGAEAVDEIFAAVSRDRLDAAKKTLALLDGHQAAPRDLMATARRLIFTKGTNAHDYKFSSAALEDYYHATPAWRNRFLATSMFNLRGSGQRDNDLIARTREALAKK